MFARIITGVDATPASVVVLAEAIRLASQQHASIRAVSVLMRVPDILGPGPGFGDAVQLSLTMKARAQSALVRAHDLFVLAGIEGDTLLVDADDRDVALILLDEARTWRADLIVLGTQARRGIRRILMGSTTESCVRNTDIPIMVVPPGFGQNVEGR